MKEFISGISILVFSLTASALEIRSSAFEPASYIPSKYTCDSEDISPPLEWKDVPEGTRSFALICDDPDAPFRTWVHWVIFNIPADRSGLPENVPKVEVLADGTVQGRNDFGRIGYGGACPPAGKPHRYFFKLYALDLVLPLEAGISKRELLQAMQGHILAEASFFGLYQR